MNKQQAIEILNNLQQVFRDEEDIENAIDFAIKELWKPEKFNYQDEVIEGLDRLMSRYSKYNPKKSDISKVLPELVKVSFRVPSFAWTCTKCWEPAEKPEYTLCKTHFDRWTNSKLTRTNYTHLVHIDTPKEVREYYNIWDIWANKWKCPKCHDVIQSLNHYDYVKCSCWHSFIDWGSDYSRHNPDLINLSVWFNHK